MTDTESIKCIASNRSFGGWHKRYTHQSSTLNCEMTFAVYLPPQAEDGGAALPVMYWLSGLTCTDENFMQKAGAQSIAAKLGVVIVAPDTSPRGEGVADDENQAYDLGLGAGFYVNATQQPWAQHYHMYDYIVSELPSLIEASFPVSQQRAISGHSMGGHGALSIALKNPGRYSSASAFSPIANPSECPWGEKAFAAYLGSNKDQWLTHDTCELITHSSSEQRTPMLIDQGDADNFLEEQLGTPRLTETVQSTVYPATVRMQEGYDHSYFFIASFIEEHLNFHLKHFS